ncbi:MAG: 2-haloalkanoic acid dehalogenase [Fimbriimonadales bacterium]|nr:MAG: 2-haloalkanoic acid dehalogenase [Fimbriimonadales bacterium]
MMSKQLLSGIQAVGFDLDDTLCVYMPVAVQARRQVFERYLVPRLNLPIETIDQHYRRAFKSMLEEIHSDHWYPLYLREGRATRTETFRRMLESLGLNTDGLAEQLSDEYAALREQSLYLHDETLEVLHALRERYLLFVVTNGPAYEQRRELQILGLEGLFTVVAIEGERGIGKPHKPIFEWVESQLQLPPEQILFVGNSWEHDVQGALNAGWRAAWVNREGAPHPNPESPVLVLPNLRPLVEGL